MKIGNVCTVSSSKRIFASEYTKEGIPFYRGQEITELAKGNKNFKSEYISVERFNELSKKYYIPQKDDILITAVGTIGNMYMVEENDKFYYKDGNIILLSRFDESVNPYYVYYYLQLPGVIKKIKTAANNSVQKALTLDLMRDVDIILPDKPTQDRIVEKVKPLYDKMKLNNLVIEKLLNTIDDIYRYWFYDFKFPDKKDQGYILNGEFKIEKEKKIPKNWSISPINKSRLCTPIKNGIDHFTGEKIYLSTSEVDKLNYDTTQKLITYENRESRADMQPVAQSVWFAKMKKSIKHIAFVKDSPLIDSIILSTGFYGLKCSDISFEYIWSIINSNWFELKKDLISSGSTQESASDTTLSYISILEPDDETLMKYHEQTKGIIEKIYSALDENEKIIKLKNDVVYLLVNDYLQV